MLNTRDYKLNLIFGRKGCGKSSTLAKLACEGIRRKQHVYSNVLLNLDSPLYHYIENSDFGFFKPEPDSLFVLDEVNIDWDNRNFRNFNKATQTFFRYQRHFRCTVFLFSQTVDTDKKIRDLTDQLWIAKKVFKFFTVLKKVNKFIYITSPEESHGNSDIVEAYEQVKFFIPGARKWIFLPRYWKMYDSFALYDLPDLDTYQATKK